ncbi:uncharacterized protein SPPG_08311 [Spizellomyces punctatus DAOM BR117]|uniref:Uncharacterized protein n=1 Tax=Spizellomyces punctatus (strain DAOM BR117) TaxID=645134 RepID=A0A0L0H6Q3_SPIPD|nr:uncharacterized protein SPPG_08311 [Spizellomyces punctatus DAOM BR117]KNC96413.1 hypothetical protein SPPG_08311 [Spizellomyces punctatus DAOM BR117]|eukprot:XP_016604453.1 hypothetical protein SPPG_08311 [Spizellomyces punctatus DAOM BR117]
MNRISLQLQILPLLSGVVLAQGEQVVVLRPNVTDQQRTFNIIVRSILLAVFVLSIIAFFVIFWRRQKQRRAYDQQLAAMGLPPGSVLTYGQTAMPPPNYYVYPPQGPPPAQGATSRDQKGEVPSFGMPEPAYSGGERK